MIGAETVTAIRGGPWRTRIWVASNSREAREAVCGWLGVGADTTRPQTGSDLGARMETALRTELTDTTSALIVGTDIPGIGRDTIADAFDALGTADVVIGPATDGGYYLIGMRQAHPELFRDIPWSTDGVLPRTLAAAESKGLDVALLDVKTDVDTVSDVPAGYLTP